MDTLDLRTQILKAYGAGPNELEELLTYNQNLFDGRDGTVDTFAFPLADEPHIEVWQEYVEAAQEKGVFAVLTAALVQLRFPIRSGISTSEIYRQATRKGCFSTQSTPGLTLQEPDELALFIYPTLAGAIPVIVSSNRADFVSLLQAFTQRNEPVDIPHSMGACIIGGYNNWDRVKRYRRQWESRHPHQCSEQDWLAAFSRLVPQKALYQDRFILLSHGAYSNVTAAQLGLDEDEWLRLSLIIRREHECIHYFTRRCFQSMRNHVLDELIADYFGILAANGTYRADWFLQFVGLERFPAYRDSGRLHLYLGNPTLSEGAFEVLKALVKKAAENLEQFDRTYLAHYRTASGRLATLLALVSLTIEELASDTGLALMQTAVEAQQTHLDLALS
ncbi:hypothetical protein PN498_01225 [Oscillatoria sp. CS-180]|uniref:DUF7005 family protein n=1 Tax=Oscillatoria sp. CS-180 TaxID=3021720 RepID=UPI002331572B|nr:hypothetical protein [Oscillatoria sp. CS-180]MDB9524595.1 hypothetical protein [Oscillatoria sp. CS-180]